MSGTGPARWFERAPLAFSESALNPRASPGRGAAARVTRSHSIIVVEPITRNGLRPWQARRVTTHIDANLAAPIRIKDLASLADISTSHFCRTFKCTFGYTARAWIARRRIEAAQSLMLLTHAPLSEIALSCGMSDQSHFTRAFRRIVGETPQSWRRTLRASRHYRPTSPERGSPSLRLLCAHSERD
jgi:AraC-like DNA-binding protein